MFTGIIEEIGILSSISQKNNSLLYSIKSKKIQENLKVGESVACNGICLTIVSFDASIITAQVRRETLSKTTIKKWKIGEKINLERALKVGGRLDGHIVQGHIDTASRVLKTYMNNNTFYVEVNLPVRDSALVIPQGSIALNGVSLTIASVYENSFKVALIDLTQAETNISDFKANDFINIEYDIVGKYILKSQQIKASKKNLSEEFLLKNGF